jgi:hypothetical protein
VNKVILIQQKPLCDGNEEVAKRSGRNEPMWVAIHKCLEAMLGISLYSYLYFKLARTLCLSYYLLCLLFNKMGEEERGKGFVWKQGGGRGKWHKNIK